MRTRFSLLPVLGSLALLFAACDDDGSDASIYPDAAQPQPDAGRDAAPSPVRDASPTPDAPVGLDAAAVDAAQPDASGDAAPAVTMVFTNDFETALPAEVNAGTGMLEATEGFATLGPEGNRFGSKFLRSATANVVTLSLTGLPAHTSLSLDFLFAAIDSLDGTGSFPAGDFFKVTVDGAAVFRESFANALESQIQSYMPPPGITLARRVDLGFQGPGGYYTDSAYHLGADPAFQNIPHTGSSVVIVFTLEGDGVQMLTDESWAIDNLRVTVGSTPRTDGGL